MRMCKLPVWLLTLVMSICILVSAPSSTAYADSRWVGILLNGANDWARVQNQLALLDSPQAQPMVLQDSIRQTNRLRAPAAEELLAKNINRLHVGMAQTEDFTFPFVVYINPAKEFNARCTFSHVITVNAGVFSLAKTEDELAFLIAHEMAHGQKKHLLKSNNNKVFLGIAKQLYQTYSTQSYTNYQLAAIATKFISNQVFSVEQEWEADNRAFEYATRAGYNPTAGATLWTRIRQKYGDNGRSFLGMILSPDTHPTNSQRIENYYNKLAEISGGKVEYLDGSIYANKQLIASKYEVESISEHGKILFAGNLASALKAGNGTVITPAVYENNSIRLNGVSVIPVGGEQDEKTINTLISLVNTLSQSN